MSKWKGQVSEQQKKEKKSSSGIFSGISGKIKQIDRPFSKKQNIAEEKAKQSTQNNKTPIQIKARKADKSQKRKLESPTKEEPSAKKRKKKKVSWAPEDKLVQIREYEVVLPDNTTLQPIPSMFTEKATKKILSDSKEFGGDIDPNIIDLLLNSPELTNQLLEILKKECISSSRSKNYKDTHRSIASDYFVNKYQAGKTSKPVVCKFFNSSMGCRWGENCAFAHTDDKRTLKKK